MIKIIVTRDGDIPLKLAERDTTVLANSAIHMEVNDLIKDAMINHFDPVGQAINDDGLVNIGITRDDLTVRGLHDPIEMCLWVFCLKAPRHRFTSDNVSQMLNEANTNGVGYISGFCSR